MKWFQQEIGSLECLFLCCASLPPFQHNANALHEFRRRWPARSGGGGGGGTYSSSHFDFLAHDNVSQIIKEIPSDFGLVAGMRHLLLIFALCCATRAFAALQPSNLGDDELSALACACPAYSATARICIPHASSQAAPVLRFCQAPARSTHAPCRARAFLEA